MQFGSIPIAEAEGAILAHAVRAGATLFKKGRVLSQADLRALAEAGAAQVVAARLETEDVPEDEAAGRLAAACGGAQVRVAAAFTGRANLYAAASGLVRIDAARVAAFNAIDEAITLATLPDAMRVGARQMLATVKIIPFAAPRAAVEAALALLAEGPLMSLAPFTPHRAALISTALPATRPALLDKTRKAVGDRLAALGSAIAFERRCAHDAGPLAQAIREAQQAGCSPILIFGASAITDRRDVIPAALEAAGGAVLRFGMPVDPGNLLLLGRLGATPVIGLPGCARSPKLNGFDFVLWHLLADVAVTPQGIAALGVGGLLSEIPTRPQPRDERPAEAARAPRIAALILAAGQSTRMGANKLLQAVDGKPLIRHAAEAALASQAEGVTVVTGHDAAPLQAALAGLDLSFVHNSAYAGGLSTSLKAGLAALPQDADGVVVLLGDMPGIDAALIDRLIAGFDPAEGRAIVVATRGGRRGNPVLWGRRFFPEMEALEGDAGAKPLLGTYAELVAEVEAGDDAPLTDIDTPAALAAWRQRGKP